MTTVFFGQARSRRDSRARGRRSHRPHRRSAGSPSRTADSSTASAVLAFELRLLELLVLLGVGLVERRLLLGRQARLAARASGRSASGAWPRSSAFSAAGFVAAGVVVEQRLRLGDRHVLVLIEVPRGRLPVAVRRLVLIHQEERLVLVALVLQPVEGHVGDDVGRVALVLRRCRPASSSAGCSTAPGPCRMCQ